MSFMPGLIEGNKSALGSGSRSSYYRKVYIHERLGIVFLTVGLRRNLLIFYIGRKSGINLRINYLLLFGCRAVTDAYRSLVYHVGVYLVARMEVVEHAFNINFKNIVACAVLRFSYKLLGFAAYILDNKPNRLDIMSFIVNNCRQLKRIVKQPDLALIKRYTL